ncbi:phage major capsid protein [Candidatus Saccharibacteria bacterium]|nr:phage major capsid protein [Candidatus Saccharibacteria bacterium]
MSSILGLYDQRAEAVERLSAVAEADTSSADELRSATAEVESLDARIAAQAMAARSAPASNVQSAELRSESVDRQEVDDFADYLRTGEQRAMTTASGSAGALIGDSVADMLSGYLAEASPIVGAVGRRTVGSGMGTAHIPTLSSAASDLAVTTPNRGAANSDELVIGDLALTPSRYSVTVSIEDLLIYQSSMDVVQAVMERASEALARKYEVDIIARLKTATTGDSNARRTTVATSGEITLSEIQKVIYALPWWARRNGNWVLGSSISEHLAGLTISSDDSRSLLSADWQAAMVQMLGGYSVFESEAIAGALDTATDAAYFANLSKCLELAEYGVTSIVDPYSRAGEGETKVTLRAFAAIGIKATGFAHCIVGKA